MSDKSIVVWTNFWDANSIINSGHIFSSNNEKILKINLFKDKNHVHSPKNFSVHSVTLSNPDLSKQKNVKDIRRIDFFCPTYDMLKRYKKDHNWDVYRKDFIGLIKKRKSLIKEWMQSLKPDWVYILCCWENTETGAHCHREILHDAFVNSKVASEKIISIYRHGGKIKDNKDGGSGFPIGVSPNTGAIVYWNGGTAVTASSRDFNNNNGITYEYVPPNFPSVTGNNSNENNSNGNTYESINLIPGFISVPNNVISDNPPHNHWYFTGNDNENNNSDNDDDLPF